MKALSEKFPPLILLALALFYSPAGHAQDAPAGEPPPPTPPYVGDLSGNFTLVAKYTYKAPDPQMSAAEKVAQDALSPASTKPQEIDIIKNGPVRKDTLHFVDGSSRDIWRQQSFRFSVYSAHPDSIIVDVVSNSTSPTASNQYRDAADFSELSWIDGSAYRGVQMQQGKKCYFFQKNDKSAWIDAATRLPVYFDSKALQVTYTVSDPPDEPLQLPKAYAEKLIKFQRALRGQM